jgi:hypothetical protein
MPRSASSTIRGGDHECAPPCPSSCAGCCRLLTPRVVAGAKGRHRALELDEAAFARSARALVRALEGGRSLTRPELYAALERGGVSPAGERGIHVVIDGRVRGAWRIAARARAPRLALEYWTAVTGIERRAGREAARRCGRFFGIELEG